MRGRKILCSNSLSYYWATQKPNGEALRWETGGVGGGKDKREKLGEKTLLCSWDRCSLARGSPRYALREVFGDLAKPGQDGRWQEALKPPVCLLAQDLSHLIEGASCL